MATSVHKVTDPSTSKYWLSAGGHGFIQPRHVKINIEQWFCKPHVAKRDGVGDQLVQIVDARLASVLGERNWQLCDCSIRLNFSRMLTCQWPRTIKNVLFHGMGLHD